MALNKLSHVFRKTVGSIYRPLYCEATRHYSLIYQPDYLEVGKSKIPLYPAINVQIRGYYFPVLESYQKWICVMANNMDIDVEENFALPAQQLKVQVFKPESETVNSEYDLNVYERNIHISEISATQYPVFLRMMEACLPEGVTLNVELWSSEKEEERYVPDKGLLELKSELETLTKK